MAYVEENLTKEVSLHPSFQEDGVIIQQDSRSSSEETTKGGKYYLFGPDMTHDLTIKKFVIRNRWWQRIRGTCEITCCR